MCFEDKKGTLQQASPVFLTMFKSLKLYLDQSIDLENLTKNLIDFNYKRCEQVSGEGDFSRRGGIIDIFPLSFELPIRIELDNEKIISIKTFNPESGEPLWQHNIVIILPHKSSGTRTAVFSEEFPLKNFVDLSVGDFVVHNQHATGASLTSLYSWRAFPRNTACPNFKKEAAVRNAPTTAMI